MKINQQLSIIVLVLFLLSSCSHKVVRINYQKPSDEVQLCDVPIKKSYPAEATNTRLVGRLELKDSGFSVSCNEIKAMTILKKEACSQNADFIVITEERRPDFSSSCYRCKAEFYQFKGDGTLEKEEDIKSDFDDFEVAKRVIEDKKRNRRIFWTSFGVGVMIGILTAL